MMAGLLPHEWKFPVGRWAVAFGLSSDVEYSIGNWCAGGQGAGVSGWMIFRGCVGTYHRRIGALPCDSVAGPRFGTERNLFLGRGIDADEVIVFARANSTTGRVIIAE